jgi:uncharacterized membrane protein YfcA
MKPVGAGVHLRRGTVDLRLVKWLVIGSVPSAFCGALLLDQLGDGTVVQDRIKLLLGTALLVAAGSMVLKQVVARGRTYGDEPIAVKPLPTLLIGLAGGLIVGLSSVGSGSLMIVMLLALYPSLSARQLVGTDLVQAIPLVGAAALGHLLFGDFHLDVTTSLLVGSVPGVYLGARVSSRAPDGLIRPVLVVVLVASALKLLGASTGLVGAFLVLAAVAGAAALYLRTRSNPGSPASTAVTSSPGSGRE